MLSTSPSNQSPSWLNPFSQPPKSPNESDSRSESSSGSGSPRPSLKGVLSKTFQGQALTHALSQGHSISQLAQKKATVEQEPNYKFVIYDYLSAKQKEYVNQKASERFRRRLDDFSVSLKDIIQDQRGILSYFDDFLKTQYSEENMDFLREMAVMRKAFVKYNRDLMKKFIETTAPTPINITYRNREALYATLPLPSFNSDHWNDAVDEILLLLETDQIPKFLQSPEFQTWKECESKRREDTIYEHEMPPWSEFLDTIEQQGADEALEALLRKGASVHDCTISLQSALHIAAGLEHRLVSFLLQRWADPNAFDANLWTPLHVAADKFQCKSIELLIQYGGHNRGITTEGTLPIHHFVKNKIKPEDYEIAVKVAILLVNNVNINQQTVRGETPLHYCLRSKCLKLLEVLLAHGANCNITNKRGNSAFHTALIMNWTEAISLMLENGADLSVKSREQSPFDLVANKPEIITLLNTKGTSSSLTERKVLIKAQSESLHSSRSHSEILSFSVI
jgi:ankyrin repeat protein